MTRDEREPTAAEVERTARHAFAVKFSGGTVTWQDGDRAYWLDLADKFLRAGLLTVPPLSPEEQDAARVEAIRERLNDAVVTSDNDVAWGCVDDLLSIIGRLTARKEPPDARP